MPAYDAFLLIAAGAMATGVVLLAAAVLVGLVFGLLDIRSRVSDFRALRDLREARLAREQTGGRS